MIPSRGTLFIAEVFHRAGLIEKWSRGTKRVVAQCRQAGITPPEFREAAGLVVVTFRVAVGKTIHMAPQVTPQVAPQVTARCPNSVAVREPKPGECILLDNNVYLFVRRSLFTHLSLVVFRVPRTACPFTNQCDPSESLRGMSLC